MGANSIDISQWRSRIGTFPGKKCVCNTEKASGLFANRLKPNALIETLMILSYLLVLSNVTQKLLIMSGVELNPGPETFSIGKKYLMFISTFDKHGLI